MIPTIATIFALLLLAVAITASAVMLELKGRAVPPAGAHKWLRRHRALGRLFVMILTVMVVMMILKVSEYQEELNPRALIHAVLAMALLVLVFVKIWVAKRLPNLTSHLFILGTAVLALTVAMVGITAGHYLLHRTDLRYVTLDEQIDLAVDEELGRQIMSRKCNKCHSFERILLSTKDRKGWEETVNRMAVYDAPNITAFDIKQITHYIIEFQKQRFPKRAQPSTEELGNSLVRNRCSRCHTLDRIFAAEKTMDEWHDTVARMTDYAGDPPLLSEQERETVLNFLSNKDREK